MNTYIEGREEGREEGRKEGRKERKRGREEGCLPFLLGYEVCSPLSSESCH